MWCRELPLQQRRRRRPGPEEPGAGRTGAGSSGELEDDAGQLGAGRCEVMADGGNDAHRRDRRRHRLHERGDPLLVLLGVARWALSAGKAATVAGACSAGACSAHPSCARGCGVGAGIHRGRSHQAQVTPSRPLGSGGLNLRRSSGFGHPPSSAGSCLGRSDGVIEELAECPQRLMAAVVCEDLAGNENQGYRPFDQLYSGEQTHPEVPGDMLHRREGYRADQRQRHLRRVCAPCVGGRPARSGRARRELPTPGARADCVTRGTCVTRGNYGSWGFGPAGPRSGGARRRSTPRRAAGARRRSASRRLRGALRHWAQRAWAWWRLTATPATTSAATGSSTSPPMTAPVAPTQKAASPTRLGTRSPTMGSW
jgi:hypothetical protein